MTIEWKDSYKIGNAEIDKQHEYLFELTNEMIAVDSMTSLRPLIMLLFKHTREHFELEEALMRKHNMPDVEVHVEGHNKLLNRLSLLSMDVGKGHMNKRAIAELMSDWALNHVTKDDAKIAEYLLASPGE
jgi:hemerythrin